MDERWINEGWMRNKMSSQKTQNKFELSNYTDFA